MQNVPLAIPHIFERAEKYFAHKEIVTATGTGLERMKYGQWAERTRKLGGVLDDLGISADGRVATFAWNTARHLELYFAAPCTGRVLHTLNIRLFPEQLTYIVEPCRRRGDLRRSLAARPPRTAAADVRQPSGTWC